MRKFEGRHGTSIAWFEPLCLCHIAITCFVPQLVLYPKRASLYLKLHVKELGNERSYSRNKLGETDNI
jgi:hypothetical protein